MALTLAGVAAGGLAAAAYLDAKLLLRHDHHHLLGSRSATAAQNFVMDRAIKKRLLNYHILEEQALHKRPDHLFLIFEGQEWTYGEFFKNVLKVGNWLMKDLGIREGEIVAMDGPNSPEYLVLWFALDAIGAAPSFINCHLTAKPLVHCVELCDSRFLIADTDIRELTDSVEKKLQSKGVKLVYYSPDFFASLTDDSPIPESRRDWVKPDTIRSLIYTSGTTGLPKGTKFLTGREMLVGFSVSNYLRLKPSDRLYTCMPMYHGAAHGLCVDPALHAGCTVVLGRKFSHKTFWPEVRASKATIIQYVGELCRYLVNGPPSPLDKKHNVQMAWGNGMRPDVWETFRERFGIPVINELYAATDGMGSTFNENKGDFGKFAIGKRGVIWKVLRGPSEKIVKIDVATEQIVRNEQGFAIECAVGEPGETIHKLDPVLQDQQCPGYYKNTAAGDKRKVTDVFRKGDLWLRSGDMMRMDPDGCVYFVDRLGDTFRWKSENVSTNEVSDIYSLFDQIAESNVYGVLVPKADGRAGCAAIVMADGVTEERFDFARLAEHGMGTLPRYAVPIFLRFTPELHYTGTLKMQKAKMRQEGIELDKMESKDKFYWLPNDAKTYIPFTQQDLDDLRSGRQLL